MFKSRKKNLEKVKDLPWVTKTLDYIVKGMWSAIIMTIASGIGTIITMFYKQQEFEKAFVTQNTKISELTVIVHKIDSIVTNTTYKNAFNDSLIKLVVDQNQQLLNHLTDK
jgi:hypothetical protein